jgi:hypothetical protein
MMEVAFSVCVCDDGELGFLFEFIARLNRPRLQSRRKMITCAG